MIEVKVPKRLKVNALAPVNDERIAAVIADLPEQRLAREHLDAMQKAKLAFGLPFTKQQLEREIMSRVPRKARKVVRRFTYNNWRRTTVTKVVWATIEKFAKPIPDQALVKYAEARAGGCFDQYHVLDVARVTEKKYLDPWLVGRVSGHKDAFVVLAYWDDVAVAREKAKV